MQAFDVFGIENAGHGFDLFKFFFDGVDMSTFEDLRVEGGFISVVGKDVPTTENELVQGCDGQEIFEKGHSIVGSFSEADGSQLRQRTYGFCEAFSCEQASGHERCGDGSKAWKENAKFAIGGCND